MANRRSGARTDWRISPLRESSGIRPRRSQRARQIIVDHPPPSLRSPPQTLTRSRTRRTRDHLPAPISSRRPPPEKYEPGPTTRSLHHSAVSAITLHRLPSALGLAYFVVTEAGPRGSRPVETPLAGRRRRSVADAARDRGGPGGTTGEQLSFRPVTLAAPQATPLPAAPRYRPLEDGEGGSPARAPFDGRPPHPHRLVSASIWSRSPRARDTDASPVGFRAGGFRSRDPGNRGQRRLRVRSARRDPGAGRGAASRLAAEGAATRVVPPGQ